MYTPWPEKTPNNAHWPTVCCTNMLALTEMDDIQNLLDWSAIKDHLRANPLVEKAWPPLLMFKVLLLQAWYNLNDPAC